MRDEDKKPGPGPDHLEIDEDHWEDAVKKALKKKRPKGGWPDKPKKGENMEKPEHRKQRQDGAAAIVHTIRKNTGVSEKDVQMSWNPDPAVRYRKYTFEVTTVGDRVTIVGDSAIFPFIENELADYVGGPSGITNSKIMAIEGWITSRLTQQQKALRKPQGL